MKTPTKIPVAIFVALVLCYSVLSASSPSGFYLPDPYDEVSIRYTNVKNLIILPVVINGNIKVNLILDTGTRNIVLFGKRFQNLFEFVPKRMVQFSGVGSGEPVYGKLSIGNSVELKSLIGDRIPIVVVPNKNIFGANSKIDGIIGYEIFQRFEVEINPIERLVTFRSPTAGIIPEGFVKIPIRICNSVPVIDSRILLDNDTKLQTDLLIDTGSQLDILIKTTNNFLTCTDFRELLGMGMSGNIEGVKTIAKSISMEGLDFYDLPTGIISSEWHNYGSIGMGILCEYVVIINYAKAYTCLKKV